MNKLIFATLATAFTGNPQETRVRSEWHLLKLSMPSFPRKRESSKPANTPGFPLTRE